MHKVPALLKSLAVFILAAGMILTSCKKSSTLPAAPSNPPTKTFSPTFTSTGYCGGTFATCTPTDSMTPTPSLTASPTYTPTPTPTLTGTPTDTGTPTSTSTPTDTRTPSSTPTDTPTNLGGYTSTPTSTVPAGSIVWYSATVAKINTGALSAQAANLYLRVNGTPESTATVLLADSNGTTLVMTYNGASTQGGLAYAQYMVTIGFNYEPGLTYTFVTDTSVGAAQASVVAPGDITHAPDGSSSSWSVEGNEDEVTVVDAGNNERLHVGPDAVSSVAIPSSAYSGCGNNRLTTMCVNHSMAIMNATLMDGVWGGQMLQTTVSNTSTCTPVPSATSSMTPPAPPTGVISTPTATVICTESGTGYTCTPTITPTPWIPMGIYVQGYFSRMNGCADQCVASGGFRCTDSNGSANAFVNVDRLPVTDADVSIIDLTSGVTANLPYLTDLGACDSYGNCVTMALYMGGSLSYVPGHQYRLFVDTTAGQGWADATAPGGVSVGSNGDSTDWSFDGNSDHITIEDAACTVVYSSTTDPTPPVDLTARYPSPGSYTVEVSCVDTSTTSTNLAAGSILSCQDNAIFAVTR